MQAHNDYVTLELIDEPSLIIQTNKDKSPKGKVTSIGHLVKDVKVGDIVYYYASRGEPYMGHEFVKENQIICVENG